MNLEPEGTEQAEPQGAATRAAGRHRQNISFWNHHLKQAIDVIVLLLQRDDVEPEGVGQAEPQGPAARGAGRRRRRPGVAAGKRL